MKDCCRDNGPVQSKKAILKKWLAHILYGIVISIVLGAFIIQYILT